MGKISTHILDLQLGKPASSVKVSLEKNCSEDHWKKIHTALTDNDGRINNFLTAQTPLEQATYRLLFHTQPYFEQQQREVFYPFISVIFHIKDENQNYHIPILLNNFGYSTYRGS